MSVTAGDRAGPWPLRRDEPGAAGLAAALPGVLDRVLADAIRPPEPCGRVTAAGAVCVVARRGIIAVELAHGVAQTHDGEVMLAQPRPVSPATRFDVASVTKLIATAAATLSLVDRGDLRLSDDLGTLLPELAATAHDPRFARITVAELLSHRGGLAAWEPTYLHAADPEGALARVAQLPLVDPPGHHRRYSDLSMMLLGAVVAAAGAAPLEEVVDRLVIRPLSLASTGYGPIGPTAAATSLGNPYEHRMIATGEPYPVTGDPHAFDRWRHHTLVGEVNDGNAHYGFGGVAGHAGVFATATDLVRSGHALLLGVQGRDTPLAAATTVRRFLAPDTGPVLGAWEGRLEAVLGAGSGGLGHGGFTGCELLIDPERELVVALVSNRQHPGEPYPSIAPLWHRVLRLVLDGVG